MSANILLKNADIAIEAVEREIKKISREQINIESNRILGELRRSTPIDTGFARASWLLIIGKDRNFLRNKAPYIDLLNQGYSKQAPKHFIERTVLRRARAVGTIVRYTL